MANNIHAVEVNGKRYVACSWCVTDSDFKSYVEEISSGMVFQSPVIVVNPSNHAFINSESGSQPLSMGILKTIELSRFGNLFDGDIGYQFSTSVVENNASDVELYVQYISKLNEVKQGWETQIAPNKILDTHTTDLGYIDLSFQNMTWGGNDFVSQYQGVLENLYTHSSINPFYFLSRQLTFRLHTSNGYSVYLVRYPFNSTWKVIFVRKYGSLDFVDNNLESLEFTEQVSENALHCSGHSWMRVCSGDTLEAPPSVTSYFKHSDDPIKGKDKCAVTNPSCNSEELFGF